MKTLGFACGRSNAVTIGETFADINGNETISSYIKVTGSGAEGALVYMNSAGEPQYDPWVFFGYNPIAATMIVESATIGIDTYTTTATGLSWCGSVNA